jgi:hypothetical protein
MTEHVIRFGKHVINLPVRYPVTLAYLMLVAGLLAVVSGVLLLVFVPIVIVQFLLAKHIQTHERTP